MRAMRMSSGGGANTTFTSPLAGEVARVIERATAQRWRSEIYARGWGVIGISIPPTRHD
jgi:hypothetical protein